jgi:hypothetical protein
MSAVLRAAPWSERLPVPRRQHLEDDLQRQICQFLAVALPPDATYFHIPNGGLRSKRQAARLKGLGVMAGISDLCVIYRGRAFFLELKSARGVMSAAQKEMARKLNYCGAAVMLCRSVDEVEQQLRESCIPLRASVL